MTSNPTRLLLALTAATALVGCGTSFREAHPSLPVMTVAGGLRVEVKRTLLTEDVLTGGVGEDTALVVELDVTNDGPRSHDLSVVSLSCLMELDAAAPGETLSLQLGAGGDGGFPGAAGADILVVPPIPVPPGQTRTVWALFHGYRFPGSQVPRRITLTMPGSDGHTLRVVLADPARGRLRWNIAPDAGGMMLGAQNTMLFGTHLRATAMSTALTRLTRLGRLLVDASLVSTVLVQSRGALVSPTSAFMGTGLDAHVTAPILTWGAELDPRQLGIYAGGQAHLLISIEPPRAADDTTPPKIYGALAVDAGLDLEIGARRPAPTPFPLSIVGRSPPRWFLRVGYTHWWVGGGSADGYTTSFRLAF